MVVLGLSMTHAALAAPYELDYSVEDGCPDFEGFVAQISQRVRNAKHAPEHADLHFSVRIVRRGAEWRGEVDLGADGVPRDVAGATCDSVASALALIVAVAIDPTIVLDLPAPAPAERTPPRRAPQSDDLDEPRKPSSQPSSRALGLLGGGGSVASGPGPTPLHGWHVFGEVEPEGRTGPALRAAFSRASSGAVEVGSGSARFVLTTARIEGCPGAVATGDLLLTGCAAAEGGAIHAEGLARTALAEPGSVTRPWGELGVATRFSWVIASTLRLEVFGGVAAPLTRRAFVFENPREVVHQAPLLIGRAGVSLAAEIP